MLALSSCFRALQFDLPSLLNLPATARPWTSFGHLCYGLLGSCVLLLVPLSSLCSLCSCLLVARLLGLKGLAGHSRVPIDLTVHTVLVVALGAAENFPGLMYLT